MGVQWVKKAYAGKTVDEAKSILSKRYPALAKDKKELDSMAKTLDEHLKSANNAFEMNAMGGRLYDFEGVKWASKWLMSRLLELAEKVCVYGLQKGGGRRRRWHARAKTVFTRI
jgi:hypothetical protein